MATGGLLPSQMLATTGLGSDNNDFVGDFWYAPATSGPSGAAVPAIGSNYTDPTQVGDTGSTVAADDSSSFDVNQLFDSIFSNAFKAYQVSQSGPGKTTFTPAQQFALQQQQLQLKAQQASSSSNMNLILIVGVIVAVVLVLIFVMRK